MARWESRALTENEKQFASQNYKLVWWGFRRLQKFDTRACSDFKRCHEDDLMDLAQYTFVRCVMCWKSELGKFSSYFKRALMSQYWEMALTSTGVANLPKHAAMWKVKFGRWQTKNPHGTPEEFVKEHKLKSAKSRTVMCAITSNFSFISQKEDYENPIMTNIHKYNTDVDFMIDSEFIANAVKHLDERELRIIKERFYEGKTLQEIGDKMGMTRERVRQLESGALKKMRLSQYKKYAA